MAVEDRKKYLFKNTFIFSLGNLGTKLITFLLVPLYTYVLTTSEYGVIDLINVLSTVIVPVITLNISEAIMRFCLDKNSNKKQILDIGFVIIFIDFIISIIIIPFLYLFSSNFYTLLLIIIYIFSFSCSSIFLCYIRGAEKLFEYSIINIIQTFLIASLNFVFLIYFKLGINGYILSYIISFSISSILCLLVGKIEFDFANFVFNKKLFKDMTKFSLLLIPNSLMWWIMNSLDKVMVSKMIGLDANGIYSVSYKIPSILITITAIFNQAWMFSAIKEKDSSDKNQFTNNVFDFLCSFIFIMASCLILIIKPLLLIYVGRSFYSAWFFIPPLLIGTVFLTVSTFLSNEYSVHKDSRGFLCSSSIGAFINLILNFLLIPNFGIIGAAIATCISYISVFLFRAFDTKKYISINYFNFNRFFGLLILLIMSILIYFDNFLIYFLLFFLFILLLIINYKYLLFFIKTIIKLLKRRELYEKK